MSWNVHGLSERPKRLQVRQSILLEKPSIVCMQETKMATMDTTCIREVCGWRLKNTRILDAEGTRGGVIVAWSNTMFQELDHTIGRFSVTVLLQHRHDNGRFLFTGVYGPSTSHLMREFLQELTALKQIGRAHV